MTESPSQLTRTNVITLGDSSVGKTCLLTRFVSNQFDQYSNPTLGAVFLQKTFSFSYNNTKKSIKFQLEDTAGQQKYKSITSIYYKNAHAAICMYDITKKKTFLGVKKWIEDLKAKGPKQIVIALVGNKIDRSDQEEVPFGEANQYAKEIGAIFKLVSAKDGTGVQELFTSIAERLEYFKEKKLFRVGSQSRFRVKFLEVARIINIKGEGVAIRLETIIHKQKQQIKKLIKVLSHFSYCNFNYFDKLLFSFIQFSSYLNLFQHQYSYSYSYQHLNPCSNSVTFKFQFAYFLLLVLPFFSSKFSPALRLEKIQIGIDQQFFPVLIFAINFLCPETCPYLFPFPSLFPSPFPSAFPFVFSHNAQPHQAQDISYIYLQGDCTHACAILLHCCNQD